MIDYQISVIQSKTAKEFIKKHHYSKGCHNGASPCFGLFDKNDLIGVLAVCNPCSEAVKASVFGEELKDSVRELHRLVILDDTPKNTESWFISRALKEMQKVRPDIKCLISFADETEGHNGTIYQASNALYCGRSAKATFFLDEDGRLRHPRQNGVNITIKEAKKRGWMPTKRLGKFRYIFILGSRKQKKRMMEKFKLTTYNYPKGN
jgi:hypothetical protein